MSVHGGDWAGFQTEYGTLPLDFSANISPLGLPEGVKEALISSVEDAEPGIGDTA
jgi:threonine-phosphate decarboxylase